MIVPNFRSVSQKLSDILDKFSFNFQRSIIDRNTVTPSNHPYSFRYEIVRKITSLILLCELLKRHLPIPLHLINKSVFFFHAFGYVDLFALLKMCFQ